MSRRLLRSATRASMLIAALAVSTLSSVARAQRGGGDGDDAANGLRTLDVARQLRDTLPFAVRVPYAVGKLSLRAAATPVLYRAQLVYAPGRADPVYRFDSAGHALTIGVGKASANAPGDVRRGELRLDLAPTVPVDLTLELGAVQADLDFGGLRLNHLRLESGASDATVRFDAPNVERMRVLDLMVGAASLTALRLGNANASEINVRAGVGDVDLDLGGTWSHDVDLTVGVALGRVQLRVPRDVGVRVEVEKMLASFRHDGLVRRGDAWYSENWDSATHKLRVKARTTFGRLEITQTAR